MCRLCVSGGTVRGPAGGSGGPGGGFFLVVSVVAWPFFTTALTPPPGQPEPPPGPPKPVAEPTLGLPIRGLVRTDPVPSLATPWRHTCALVAPNSETQGFTITALPMTATVAAAFA